MISVRKSTSAHIGPAGSSFVPDTYLKTISHALRQLHKEMRDSKPCNDEFAALSGGRSFSTLLDDSSIWINYDTKNNGADWGWTIPGSFPNDLVITQYALRMGYWSTAATIVHELAHLNGADGISHAAEHTVRACHMKSKAGPYNPHILGQVVRRLGIRIT